MIVGIDELYGKGKQESDNFEYEVGLDGEGAPNSHSLHIDESTDLEDSRSFTGLYAQADWQPTPRLDVNVGVRLNHTRETLEGGVEPHEEDAPLPAKQEGEEEESTNSDKTLTRTSGVIGLSWLAYATEHDGFWLFADFRKSFKPAAIDFGPEAEGDILEPETSKSVEVGAKGSFGDQRLRWQLTAFEMKLENLLLPQDLGFINGGKQRFRGVELEGSVRLAEDLSWRFAGAWHQPEFTDFVQDFDGEPVQLAGNRPELAPEKLWSTGLAWAPAAGFNAHAQVEWVGDRFLSRRNTVLAPSYTEWGAGIGYRFPTWDLRLDGENLGDERAAVSESELGDAQFYRLPARALRLTAGVRF